MRKLASLLAASVLTSAILLMSAPAAQAQFVCGGSATGAEPQTGDSATATGGSAVACGTLATAPGAASLAVGLSANAVG